MSPEKSNFSSSPPDGTFRHLGSAALSTIRDLRISRAENRVGRLERQVEFSGYLATTAMDAMVSRPETKRDEEFDSYMDLQARHEAALDGSRVKSTADSPAFDDESVVSVAPDDDDFDSYMESQEPSDEEQYDSSSADGTNSLLHPLGRPLTRREARKDLKLQKRIKKHGKRAENARWVKSVAGNSGHFRFIATGTAQEIAKEDTIADLRAGKISGKEAERRLDEANRIAVYEPHVQHKAEKATTRTRQGALLKALHKSNRAQKKLDRANNTAAGLRAKAADAEAARRANSEAYDYDSGQPQSRWDQAIDLAIDNHSDNLVGLSWMYGGTRLTLTGGGANSGYIMRSEDGSILEYATSEELAEYFNDPDSDINNLSFDKPPAAPDDPLI